MDTLNRLAVVLGYGVMLAAAVGAVFGVVMAFRDAIVAIQDSTSSAQIKAKATRIAQSLHGMSYWFSEDPPTTLLLQSIAHALEENGTTGDCWTIRSAWRTERSRQATLDAEKKLQTMPPSGHEPNGADDEKTT